MKRHVDGLSQGARKQTPVWNLWEILSEFWKNYENVHERFLFTNDSFFQ